MEMQVGRGKKGKLDPACYNALDIKNSPLLGEKKVSEGQKNELLKKNLCTCHIFHNC